MAPSTQERHPENNDLSPNSHGRGLWQRILAVANYAIIPVKYKSFYFAYKDREFNLLDVGCGFHAPQKALKYFRYCNYYGIDRDIMGNDDADLTLMHTFYRIDLDREKLEGVPCGHFDVIIFSHVIEHLHHGLDVLAGLARRVKPGGSIYIEFPGLRSFSTPRARKGCLHFCDDPTHVKVYHVHDIINTLLENEFTIVRAGTRRDKVRLLLTPALIARGIFKGDVWSGGLWDVFGFADFVLATKPIKT